MHLAWGSRALALLAAVAALAAGPARAQSARPLDRLDRIEATLQEQERRLDEQELKIQAQEQLIDAQRSEIAALREERDTTLATIRAGGAQAVAEQTRTRPTLVEQPVPNTVSEGLPVRPMGEPPPAAEPVAEVAALPEGMAVLTPPGSFVFDPSVEYVRSSANRLVFRGVEIVPGVQLGVIEANDADRGSAVATAAVRYGLTRRLEVEARLPYVTRNDRITTVAQRDETVSRTMTLTGQEIGDAEVSARYQLNSGRNGAPVFVGSARVKSPSGVGPYDVAYDEFGVARQLATGSGFWAAETGLTMLYPTDPAVIFAGLTYLHNFPRTIGKTIGGAEVGKVEPGDSIGVSLGFGLALNPRFSFSLGYSHSYIFETNTQLAGAFQSSQPLQVGSILMGWSYRLSNRLTLSNNFEFGVTSDAPDVRIVVRTPIRF